MVTWDFPSERVREHIARVVPDDDVMRYRFGDTIVMFRPIDGDPNRLDVTEVPIGF